MWHSVNNIAAQRHAPHGIWRCVEYKSEEPRQSEMFKSAIFVLISRSIYILEIEITDVNSFGCV